MIDDMITQTPEFGWDVKKNQSPEHQDLCKRCLVWLANKTTGRGLRGCNELELDDGYIADAVAIASLQMRFYEQFLRLRAIYKYPGRRLSPTDQRELESRPKNEFVFIFEAKASRSDYISTFGEGIKHQNRMSPVGNFHFIVARKGVCNVEEIPDFWGLLMASGVGLSLLKIPQYVGCSLATVQSIAYSILWKRPTSLRHIRYCPDCHKEIDE